MLTIFSSFTEQLSLSLFLLFFIERLVIRKYLKEFLDPGIRRICLQHNGIECDDDNWQLWVPANEITKPFSGSWTTHLNSKVLKRKRNHEEKISIFTCRLRRTLSDDENDFFSSNDWQQLGNLLKTGDEVRHGYEKLFPARLSAQDDQSSLTIKLGQMCLRFWKKSG